MTKADVAATAEVLADAFADDPFWAWLFPGAPRDARIRAWTRFMRIVYMPKGHSYVSDGLEGAALWAPPGGWRMSIVQQLRTAPGYLRMIGVRRIGSAMRSFEVIERAHPDERHWYLSVLGVAPSRQRSGAGRSLLEPMLERADREGVAAYLETFRPDNVPYYERFGFEVVKEDQIDGGPHMWAMSRRPG
jgi:ribosomal protein S18 acetylase RimI-like enzyme